MDHKVRIPQNLHSYHLYLLQIPLDDIVMPGLKPHLETFVVFDARKGIPKREPPYEINGKFRCATFLLPT